MPRSIPGAEPAAELIYLDGRPAHRAFLPHRQRLFADAGTTPGCGSCRFLPRGTSAAALARLREVSGHDVDPAAPGHVNGLHRRVDTASAGLTGTSSGGCSLTAVN